MTKPETVHHLVLFEGPPARMAQYVKVVEALFELGDQADGNVGGTLILDIDPVEDQLFWGIHAWHEAKSGVTVTGAFPGVHEALAAFRAALEPAILAQDLEAAMYFASRDLEEAR